MAKRKIRLGWNSTIDGFYAALEQAPYKCNNPIVEQVTDVEQVDGDYVVHTRPMELERIEGKSRVMIKVYLLEHDPAVYRLRDVVHAAGKREDLLITLKDGEVTLVKNEQALMANLAAYFARRKGRSKMNAAATA